MKNIFYEVSLLNLIEDIYSQTDIFDNKTQERNFYETISNYIYYSVNNHLRNKIIEIMETLQTHYSQDFISIADGLILEGIQKGKKDGKKEGKKLATLKFAYSMIKKGYANDEIIELTELSEKQIQILRSSTAEEIDSLFDDKFKID